MEREELQELDPNDLKIDSENEPVTNTALHTDEDKALKKSIRKNGVMEPILVRQKNDVYHVIAGQRRTLAAREVGVDSIPAQVVQMDDQEAKLASIIENAQTFNKDVAPEDRANAIDSLIEDGQSIDTIADNMGVTAQTVERWWEPARDYWESTKFEADSDQDEVNSALDELSLSAMKLIRENSSSPEQAERLAEKVIEDHIKVSLVREAHNKANSPEEFEEEIERIAVELNQGISRITEKVRFTQEEAEQLERIMENRGVDEKTVIEMLVKERLEVLKPFEDGEAISLYLPGEIADALDDTRAGTDVNKEALCRQIVKKKLESWGCV